MDWWSKYELVPPDWSGVAGLLAVLAALWVGARQIAISRELKELQNKIAADDLQIRQQNLRIELLDRRSKCVASMREIVSSWSASIRLPPEDIQKFRGLLWDAELLYPPEIVAKIEQAVEGTFWSEHWAKRSQSYFEAGEVDRAKEKREQSFEEEDRATAVMPNLVKLLIEYTRVSGWQTP
jgi:hypothetical protein